MIFRLFAITFAIAVLSSCSITMPVNATSNPVGDKVGTATATIVLGFYFNQDAGIQRAARKGGIKEISTVDIKQTNILGMVWMYETIVTGK